jgi:hypothetical protein
MTGFGGALRASKTLARFIEREFSSASETPKAKKRPRWVENSYVIGREIDQNRLGPVSTLWAARLRRSVVNRVAIDDQNRLGPVSTLRAPSASKTLARFIEREFSSASRQAK